MAEDRSLVAIREEQLKAKQEQDKIEKLELQKQCIDNQKDIEALRERNLQQAREIHMYKEEKKKSDKKFIDQGLALRKKEEEVVALEKNLKKESDRRQRVEKELERMRQEEAERMQQEEAERKRQEEVERKRQEEAERKQREEAEQKRREEAERKRQEEVERKRREEAERKRREEAERKQREEAEQKRQEEAEQRRQEDVEQKQREEVERQQKEREKIQQEVWASKKPVTIESFPVEFHEAYEKREGLQQKLIDHPDQIQSRTKGNVKQLKRLEIRRDRRNI